MSEQQPNALRLAEMFNSGRYDNGTAILAARELSRLHAAEVGSTAELLRRQNMIDSLEGLAESLRAELSRLQAAGGQGVEPVDADAAMRLAPNLHIGACITDGKLHASVMHKAGDGPITFVAMAEMDAASLHKRDCIAKMQAAAPALVPLSRDELDLCRQWFDNAQDVNGGYLGKPDYELAEKLYAGLGMRVPHSISNVTGSRINGLTVGDGGAKG